jgi:hypothetical protein
VPENQLACKVTTTEAAASALMRRTLRERRAPLIGEPTA